MNGSPRLCLAKEWEVLVGSLTVTRGESIVSPIRALSVFLIERQNDVVNDLKRDLRFPQHVAGRQTVVCDCRFRAELVSATNSSSIRILHVATIYNLRIMTFETHLSLVSLCYGCCRDTTVGLYSVDKLSTSQGLTYLYWPEQKTFYPQMSNCDEESETAMTMTLVARARMNDR